MPATRQAFPSPGKSSKRSSARATSSALRSCGDRLMIRANQGHSIPLQLDYQALTPPEILYHGTATRFLHSIKEQGLLKGKRLHVHLSDDKATAIKVGSRHGKPAVLLIESMQMHKDGFVFYKSENNVWLTDHIPPAYIKF